MIDRLVFVLCGSTALKVLEQEIEDAARWPDTHGALLALPPGKSPRDFSWPVCGKRVAIFRCGEFRDDQINELARVLIISGAKVVANQTEAKSVKILILAGQND